MEAVALPTSVNSFKKIKKRKKNQSMSPREPIHEAHQGHRRIAAAAHSICMILAGSEPRPPDPRPAIAVPLP